MKKMISALLAVSALAVAVPAMADDYGRGGYGDRGGYDRDGRGGYGENLRQTYEQIERKIERAERMRMISRREAASLMAQLRDLRRLDMSYRRSGGLNRWERADLQRRADRLEARVRFERRDRDGRPY